MTAKLKIFALSEILMVYAVMQIAGIARRSTGVVEWEIQNLGWSYTGMFIFVGIPVLVIWLGRRDWATYGVSFSDWQANLDLGFKGYLVRIIPLSILFISMQWFGMDYRTIPSGALVSIGGIIAIGLMLKILSRWNPSTGVSAARNNIVLMILLLLFPILLALFLNKLSVVIVSTVFWQFIFSGFGEEFVWRGYVQSRLNQAFGRPMRMFSVQFGWGLIIASLLFGLLHAFNTYDPAIGIASLSWGWALFTMFDALLFGLMREKTGTLLAPGIAHGLPDAVGEALVKIFGWVL